MPFTAITTFTNILYFPTVELIQNTPPTLILYNIIIFLLQTIVHIHIYIKNFKYKYIYINNALH